MFREIESVLSFIKNEPKFGDKSTSIEVIQKILSKVGLYSKSKIDSVYGPNTKRAVYDYVEIYYLDKTGKITTILNQGGLDYRTTDDLGKVPLRPGGGSRYSMTKDGNKVIVVHWTAGPTTAKSLHDFFSRTDRAVSSHFAIDKTGTYQYLPASRRAYHAGWINTHSIGIDICQPVQSGRLSDAQRSGYKTEIIDNPSTRGERKILRLDDDIAKSTASLLLTLCDIHNIDVKFPDSDAVVFSSSSQLGNWSGIVGHHHVEASKWDIAPWMKQIQDAVEGMK